VILDKTLKRIRQIVAIIAEDKYRKEKDHRLIISWQTRSIAMVAAAAAQPPSEDLMKFAANLTIDNDEIKQFSGETPKIAPKSNVPVNASTQESQTRKNFERAADMNNFETLMMFGQGVEKGKPGH
jgi:hypothetical protein